MLVEDQTWRDQLTRLAETIPAGVIVFDQEGNIIFANPEAGRILGVPPAAMIGRRFDDPFWRLTTPDGRPLPSEELPFSRAANTRERLYNFEAAVQPHGRPRVVVSVNAAPLLDDAGAGAGAVVSFNDVTQQKTAEADARRAEERARALAEAIPHMMFTISGDGTYRDFKASKEAPPYVSPERFIGKKIDKVLPPNVAAVSHEKVSEALRTQEVQTFDYALTIDDQDRQFEARVVASSEDEVISVVRDITERRLAEAERQKGKALSDALNHINMLVHQTLDFDTLMQRVAEEAGQAIAAESTGIVLREPDGWLLKYLSGLPQEFVGYRISDRQAEPLVLAERMRQPVAIVDARQDPSVDPKMVREFRLRSILVVPLIMKGEVMGVIGFNYVSKPAKFTDLDIQFAASLGAAVSLAMENAQLFQAEHRIAETLQKALLAVPPAIEGIESGYLYRSATLEEAAVGGDFYDLFELDHGRVGILIGDVAGKGIQSAALTEIVKNTVKAYAYQPAASPAGIMAQTNHVAGKTWLNPFITVFYGELDLESGNLSYCSAGHPPPIRKTRGGAVALATGSPALGPSRSADYVEDQVTLSRGDILVCYTDGVTEARRKRELFGEERLLQLVKELPPDTPGLPELILSRITEFSGGVLADDLALLTVSRR
jgi:PAS domain S-box-containing protein